MREEHEEHEEVQEEVHPGPQEEEAAVPEYLLQAGLHRLKAPLEALVVRARVEVVPCVPLLVPTLKRRRRGVKPRKGGVAGPAQTRLRASQGPGSRACVTEQTVYGDPGEIYSFGTAYRASLAGLLL